MFMARWAVSHPRCELVGNFAIMRPLTRVTDVASDFFPYGTVPDTGPRKGMRYFVEKHLMDFVVLVSFRKVPGNRDLFLGEVACSSATLRPVECKAPHAGVKVHLNKGVRPHSHVSQISHDRIALSQAEASPARRGHARGVRCQRTAVAHAQ